MVLLVTQYVGFPAKQIKSVYIYTHSYVYSLYVGISNDLTWGNEFVNSTWILDADL